MFLSYAQREYYLHALIFLAMATLLTAVLLKDHQPNTTEPQAEPFILPVKQLPPKHTIKDHDVVHAQHYPMSDPIHDAEPGLQVEPARFPFEPQIHRVAEELEMDASLIYAVTKAESSFRPEVQSHAGAIGLMQIVADAAGTDAHWALHKERRAPTDEELKDPYTNLKLGTTYLKLLEEKYFPHVQDDEIRTMLVLAAYNWGPINVKRKLLKHHKPRDAKEVAWLLWVKAPRETYAYVKKVMKYQQQFEV